MERQAGPVGMAHRLQEHTPPWPETMKHSLAKPLPAPFVWTRIYQDPARPDVQLRLGQTGEAIAAVTSIDGRWHTTVNLHRSSHQIAGAKCGSCAQGMRWIERWLESRSGKLLVQIGEDRIRLAALEASRRKR